MNYLRILGCLVVAGMIALAPAVYAQDAAGTPADTSAAPTEAGETPAASGPESSSDATGERAPLRERPNVVLIMLDTLRADHLGCYGFKQPISPGLDKYAADGVVFEEVIAQSTWTRPSHGGLLTGLHPRTLGLYVERNEILNDKFTTLAEILKGVGYTTYGLTANPNINSVFNFHQGFDRYADSNVVFGWMQLEENSERRGAASLPPAPELFANAMDMIKNSPDPAAPHYLQINLMEAHEWTAVRPGTNMLRDEYAKKKFIGRHPFNRYPQLIRQMTDDLDTFMQELMALPGWDDTLFIFTSDHGEGLDDHPNVSPSMHHGKLMYESQVLIPWILYRKGWEPATHRVSQRVRSLEILPTVLDYLSLPVPEEMVGKSMMPVLRGTAANVPLPNLMVVESYFKGADIRAIYGKHFIYIETPKPNKGHDKKEVQPRGEPQNGTRTNQYDRRPNVVRGMSRHLEQWQKDNPKADPTPIQRDVSNEEIEQLKSIGYL